MAQRAGTFLITAAQAAQGTSQDRLLALPLGRRVLLAVADGAGGSAGGARAAELVLTRVVEAARRGACTPAGWAAALADADGAVHEDAAAGETTAVVALVGEAGVSGASVGDSGAWLLSDGRRLDLTERQRRAPRLGSGAAAPTPFSSGPPRGTLLLATDGLLRYASPSRIAAAAAHGDVDEAARQLVELVRLPSGALQDDLALVLCRPLRLA